MKSGFKQTLSNLIGAALLVTMMSCQPSQRLHTPVTAQAQAKLEQAAPVEKELVPTVSDSDEPIVKNGVTYEAPQKKIVNPQADILLGQVKMENTKIIYDPATNKMVVTGSTRILNDAKTEISSADFNLSGQHTDDESKFFLKSDRHEKSNSSEAPVVRAKVTCLAVNEKGDTDCSQAVVDFFIAYHKKVYTQQMEVAQKVNLPETPPKAPAPTQPVTPAPTSTPTVYENHA